MRKSILLTACTILLAFVAFAHVGSPGVVFEGKAGPYNVLVSVMPPEVIPGTASVTVYIESPGVEKVSVRPIFWYSGDEGSPDYDEAVHSEETAGQYDGIIWLMESGTSSIEVLVQGKQGEGTAVVPVMAIATAQNEMSPLLGWILAGLGILLVVLMTTIIGSSVSDGIVAPGQEVTEKDRRKKKYGYATALLVIGAVLFGGNAWWQSEEANYRRYMYIPPKADAKIKMRDSVRVMEFMIDSTSLKRDRLSMSYLVPDHGKLMHMFMVRDSTQDVFAHLHPKRVDTLTFEIQLPAMPAGNYQVFADVVRMNGFTETISTKVVLPEPTGSLAEALGSGDLDDTHVVSTSKTEDIDFEKLSFDKSVLICGKPGEATPLQDGSTAVFDYKKGEPFQAGAFYPLTFGINDPEGNPADLQPYMGMMGHAVVMRDDGEVYVHLHPVGNFSMASQEIIENRIDSESQFPSFSSAKVFRDSVDQIVNSIASLDEETRNELLMVDMEHNGTGLHEEHGSTVTFPYVFPSAGKYRIWIQMKRNGEILNSSFDAEVID